MNVRSIEKLFKAVANRRRLTILALVRGRRAMSVIELASELKLSFRSTSKHLQILVHEGFVEAERVGMSMEYRLAADLTSHHRTLLHLID